MRGLLLAIAIGFTLGWIDVSTAQNWDCVPHPDHEKSVVKITGSNGVSGSGVVVKKIKDSKNSEGYYLGLVLTASHCVDGMNIMFEVEFFNGKKTKNNKPVKDLPITFDPDNDLAVIRALIPNDVVPTPMSTEKPECGDQILMSGYGAGSVRHWRGTYGGSKVMSGGHIVFSWAIQGDSGGPVIYKGKVIGVICYGSGLNKYKDTQRMIVAPVNSSSSSRIKSYVDNYSEA